MLGYNLIKVKLTNMSITDLMAVHNICSIHARFDPEWSRFEVIVHSVLLSKVESIFKEPKPIKS